MPSQSDKVVEITFRVRFAETDSMGIVHHSNYLVYFEAGRVELSRQAGASYADLEAGGFSLAVSEVSLRYIAAARFDQWITVRTWADEIGSRGVRFAYEVVDSESGTVLVTGMTRLICIDHSGQVRRIPQGWHDALKAFVVDREK